MGLSWWSSFSTWAMEAIAVFATTTGALLIFLAFRQMSKLVAGVNTPEGQRAFEKHYKRLAWAFGLVSASLVLQCAAMFFI